MAARRGGSTESPLGVTWLYGFKFEPKVIAKLPERA